jgi:hypothetical protein
MKHRNFFFNFKTRVTLVLVLAMVTVTGLNNFLAYRSNIVSHFERLRNVLITIAKTVVLSIADSCDAMTSARSYRGKPLSHEEAILEIKRVSGTQFRPEVVDAFLKVMRRPA